MITDLTVEMSCGALLTGCCRRVEFRGGEAPLLEGVKVKLSRRWKSSFEIQDRWKFILMVRISMARLSCLANKVMNLVKHPGRNSLFTISPKTPF